MPFYEYECEEHGKFEVFKYIEDKEMIICPVCSGNVKRVYSVPNLTGDLPTINKKVKLYDDI